MKKSSQQQKVHKCSDFEINKHFHIYLTYMDYAYNICIILTLCVSCIHCFKSHRKFSSFNYYAFTLIFLRSDLNSVSFWQSQGVLLVSACPQLDPTSQHSMLASAPTNSIPFSLALYVFFLEGAL